MVDIRPMGIMGVYMENLLPKITNYFANCSAFSPSRTIDFSAFIVNIIEHRESGQQIQRRKPK